MSSPPSASVSREARRVFLVNMVSLLNAFNRCGEVARLLILSRIAVGGYGPGVFRPTGEFNKFRCWRDEIVRSSNPVAAKREEGDSLAAGVSRNTVCYEYDVLVRGREDRNPRVFVAR